jgi:O-antigen/teichoic acid export membrane protein
MHLLLGKARTSIAGVGTMLLLVRELSLPDFAAYSILFGLVELVSAVTGMGLIHVLTRYVPEAHAAHRHGVTRRLVLTLTFTRFAILAVALLALYQSADKIAPMIGLDSFEWALQAYLVVVLVRVCATTLFITLESLLHQGVAQTGMSTMTIVRFLALLGFVFYGQLDLHIVIMIEVATDLLGAAIMLIGLLRVLPRGGEESPGGSKNESGNERGWIRNNAARMAKFGGKGYAQHILLVPFGGSTDRLLSGARLNTTQVAMFGFAQQIVDLMDRYLPAQMFVGVIRPVLTARYSEGKGFGELVKVCNAIFKLNLFLIGGAAVGVAAGGRPFIDALTNGKEFPNIVPLILLMCLMVSLYTWRHILDMVTHTVEHNELLIVAHAIMNISVIPGFLMMPYYGVFALPISHVVGVALGCGALLFGLSRLGMHFKHDLQGLMRLALALAGGFAVAWLMPVHWFWLWKILLAGSAYVLLCGVVGVLASTERIAMIDMIKRRRGGGADPGSDSDPDPAPVVVGS